VQFYAIDNSPSVSIEMIVVIITQVINSLQGET